MDGYSKDSGSCSAQMKCPHCGEMMNLMADKGGEGKDMGNMDGDGKEWSDDEFRQAMSPRNDEQPA